MRYLCNLLYFSIILDVRSYAPSLHMFQDLIIYIFGFSLLVVTVMHRILCFVCTIQCKHNDVIIINQFTSSYIY